MENSKENLHFYIKALRVKAVHNCLLNAVRSFCPRSCGLPIIHLQSQQLIYNYMLYLKINVGTVQVCSAPYCYLFIACISKHVP